MNLGKSAHFVDGRLSEYPQGRYPQTNTWLMVTVSEYGTLCLDYGLVAALVSINREGWKGWKRSGTERQALRPLTD